jgi:two-component system, NtrC family, nitrogen regulation sensor histidine kinase NtrY
MIYKTFGWSILLRTILLFLVMLAGSWCLVKGWYAAEIFVALILIYLFYEYYRFNKKAQNEIQQFVESVHYRDFSRHFDVKDAPAELQPFRSGFNEINTTFKVISKEKETQFLHLKTILEIVDTGILSFELGNEGTILWMNESLKNLLQIPYLKTIHSLEKRKPELYKQIADLQPGNNLIITLQKDKSNIKVLISATTFETENKRYKLVAFQNVNEALDKTESQAWQKLLSVMTHEIMNSVAPITSLAETIRQRIQDSVAGRDQSALSDIETGISTIQKRSEGLLRFTETYRNLSKITKANVSKVSLIELIEHVQQLLQPTIDKKNIDLEIILRDPLMTLEADASLIEQVLINLLLNAIDAVKETRQPKIAISADHDLSNNKVTINVADNGAGIKDEVLDKIFIPFFSTKKTGSGIGLSLCKQVMILHKGNIQVQSKVGEGTVFSLVF